MKPDSRRLQIVSILNKTEAGLVTIPDLSRALGVSEMTIRRDLEYLEEHEKVRRITGGAIAYKGITEQPYAERAEQSSHQKAIIGELAARLVQDGQSILLDSGTTTRQIAYQLREKKELTVVTNNIPIAEELGQYSQIQTFLLGGLVKLHELCTVGFSVRQALEAFSVDIAFIGTVGFSLENGITDIDINEVEIKQTMIRVAREVVLVADSKKFNVSALLHVAPLTAAKKIVTDAYLPESAKLAFEAEGIEVITPNQKAQTL